MVEYLVDAWKTGKVQLPQSGEGHTDAGDRHEYYKKINNSR